MKLTKLEVKKLRRLCDVVNRKKLKDVRLTEYNYANGGFSGYNINEMVQDIIENLQEGYADLPYYIVFTKNEQILVNKWMTQLNKYNSGYKIRFIKSSITDQDGDLYDSYIEIRK